METAIGVGLIGMGIVGGGVAKLLTEQRDAYAQRLGRPVEIRRVLVRDVAKAKARGLVDASILTDDAEAFFATKDMSIVAEVAGSLKVLDPVSRSLKAGKHVVTANKSLIAAHGPELFSLARKHNASIAFEAACGGGIPIINGLKFGMHANRVRAMYGILNGTCNYILTAMTQHGKSYDVALKEAQDAGFAEADPTLDVSGRDTAEKLAILASLAFGVRANADMFPCEGISELNITDIRLAQELGYDIKLLAIAEDGEASGQPGKLSLRVHPSFVHRQEPLAQVHGSFNALAVFGHATGMVLSVGRGAGELPTASAVVADILNVASGWYPHAFANIAAWPGEDAAEAKLLEPRDVTCRYYLRINAIDRPGTLSKITTILGNHGISISAVLQHEAAAGQLVPVVVTTHEAAEGAVRDALEQITALQVTDGKPVCVRIVEMPKG